jgi:hypothetical protein
MSIRYFGIGGQFRQMAQLALRYAHGNLGPLILRQYDSRKRWAAWKLIPKGKPIRPIDFITMNRRPRTGF